MKSMACAKFGRGSHLNSKGGVPGEKVFPVILYTGFSSEIGTKLRESAVGQAGGSCYSQAALSSNDSKTLYITASSILSPNFD